MRAFAELLDALVFTPSRLGKLRLMRRYFETTPDPDRGWALAALPGSLSFREAKPALIRGLVVERIDPVLFEWSYDFVGDLAETVSLVWPAARRGQAAQTAPAGKMRLARPGSRSGISAAMRKNAMITSAAPSGSAS